MIRHIELSRRSIEPAAKFDNGRFGAELVFLGVVRGTENGEQIAGIDYSAYEPMAVQALHKIADELSHQFGPHPLFLHHALGFIPVGKASVVISVATKHSAESFTICQEYLRRLKAEVPIWKSIIPADAAADHCE